MQHGAFLQLTDKKTSVFFSNQAGVVDKQHQGGWANIYLRAVIDFYRFSFLTAGAAQLDNILHRLIQLARGQPCGSLVIK